jgi:hypothetical protein
MALGASRPVELFRKVMGVMAVLHVILLLLVVFTPGGFVWFVNAIAGVINPTGVAPNVSRLPADAIFYHVFKPEVQKADVLEEQKTVENELGESVVITEKRTTLPDHALYTAMAAAAMTIVALLAGLIFLAPERYAQATPIFLIAKAVGGVYGLLYYLFSYPYFINLMVAVFDLPIVLVVAFFWLRARSALNRAAEITPAQ